MLDLSIKASGPLSADAAVAAQEVPSFVSLVNAAVAAAPQDALQVANTVTVQPGGKTFSTIKAAMDSITDAKLQKQYVVQIGPGTYNEVVVCKPYVFMTGAGVSVTTITAPASASQMDKGTVKAASNAAIQNVSIVSVGNGWVRGPRRSTAPPPSTSTSRTATSKRMPPTTARIWSRWRSITARPAAARRSTSPHDGRRSRRRATRRDARLCTRVRECHGFQVRRRRRQHGLGSVGE